MELRDFVGAINLNQLDEKTRYVQLADFVRRKIKSGQFTAGEKMIPETDLCKFLNLSRTTVRQALELLVNEGIIIRYRRKGSFIADAKMKRHLNNLYNFSDNMLEMGVTPSSEVIKQEIIRASAEFSHLFTLPKDNDYVFYLERVRLADDKPVLVENTAIPYYLCPGIEKNDFSRESLYNALGMAYALRLNHATETIAAILIPDKDARLLKCRARDAGYKITRTAYLDNGNVYEYTTSVTRADMCEFHVDLYHKERTPLNITRTINLG